MSSRRRILVVDDDARLGASLRRALAYEGYEVAVAAEGPGALVAARDRPPDLVVLDVMLPGIDGGVSASHGHATLASARLRRRARRKRNTR